ncbi:CHAT domain-containing protein [Streptomyces sp. MBT65]|uniref:CHAT domain-containing protein n=1 Tax=Streptomyces sp. MBT65 TaxID=1488395 RepID=UPI00190D4F63|nr:CHAT domain-containing protein [Streptomyces sp. MBT65]MBK3576283.1 CHAT domain-containing protein [Streptomyces sp. MBT65]
MRFRPRRRPPATAEEARRAAKDEANSWAAAAPGRGALHEDASRDLAGMDVHTAADASWSMLIGTARAFDARVRWTSRDNLLTAEEGLAAETAWYQYRAGRLWEAAQALECGRALLLGRLVGGIGAVAVRQLRTLHQEALLGDYLSAQGVLTAVLRSQGHHDVPPAPTPVTLNGHSFSVRTGDPLADAHADLQHLEARVAHVLGTTGTASRPGMIASPQFLSTAALRHGPLVYVAAARTSGLAVTVAPGRQPVAVELPALTRAETGRLTAAVRETTSSRLLPRILVPTLDLLAESFGAWPRPPGTYEGTLNVIGAGPMALLPLGAGLREALGPSTRAGHAAAVRHAPSARVLLHARQTAEETVVPGRVLIAAVPVAAAFRGRTMRRLKRADAQAEALTRLYPGGQVLPVARTTSDVLRQLPHVGTLHFHCHGHADSTDPMDSALLLADRALTVRDVLAADGLRGRLVVLGACEGAAVSSHLPDEALGFPGVLLQAGARCVVASLWKTREDAATLLLYRFHLELLHNERTPPRALAAAQDWLRTSTAEELSAAGSRFGIPQDIPLRFSSPENWAGWTCSAG